MAIRDLSGGGAPSPIQRLKADDATNAVTDPYANPTGFVSFQQQYDANAGTAQRAAGDLSKMVTGNVKAATDAEQSNYDKYAGAVSGGTQLADTTPGGAAGVGAAGGYTGPTDPYAVSEAAQASANKASENANALQTTGGTQALLGPGASVFGAALAHHALAGQRHELQTQAQAAQTMLAGESAKGAQAVKTAQSNVASTQQQARDYAKQKLIEEHNANYGGGDGSTNAKNADWQPTDADVSAELAKLRTPQAQPADPYSQSLYATDAEQQAAGQKAQGDAGYYDANGIWRSTSSGAPNDPSGSGGAFRKTFDPTDQNPTDLLDPASNADLGPLGFLDPLGYFLHHRKK